MAEELDVFAAMDKTMDETAVAITERDNGGTSDAGGGPAPAPSSGTSAEPVAPTALSAPKSWDPKYHEHFTKIDPEVQKYIALREEQNQKGFDGYREAAAFAKKVNEALAPFAADMQELGVDPVRAIQTLMAAHSTLAKGTPEAKKGMFQKLARDFGIDVATLVATEIQQQDPALAALQARLDSVEKLTTGRIQAETQERRQITEKAVAEFFADPKNPYAEECGEQILIQLSDPKMTLEQAYKNAIWANPVTREKEIARLATEKEAAIKAEAKAKADAARKALGTRVRGDEADRPTADPLGSMDDTLRETYRAIQARPG